ncbi:hypothetical protein C0992_002105 [Termitomyces sp. T32_za158]|nr:hypothetical protein C0992_002105 [Termitomyces sp. T32_za158]
MAFQSPMISVPKKATDEVDWTSPIRTLIAQSYGENPDNYASECAQLQRCRQDAVRGAGSDLTARDLLYKYFGQLELLELRFPEIKVTFPWHDAFTNKLTTQTSIAYEKASILFQIAATHSSIAAAQSRSDPEGTKRAFSYFRSCAGMLTYINDNFLHAPSTDLSRDVVKFLSNLILAQATEVFFEKCVDEKKGSALVAKVAAQAATMYTTLNEEVKEFSGKSILDRSWVTLIQIKSKYFLSLSQYHRALADTNAAKHGDALARLALSETLAKESQRLCSSFSPSPSPTLPADASPSIVGLTKTHTSLVSTLLGTLSRENDLIYHALIPAPESLPKIDGLVVAQSMSIQEVYGAPEVQRTIGPELFRALVPMGVHESASVYSEEKAKVVRREVEGVETAQVEVDSALESMGVRAGLGKYRAMAEGRVGGASTEVGDVVPSEVRRAAEEIARLENEGEGGVESMLAELGRLKERVTTELEGLQRELDKESRECEEMRVKWEHRWTQEPSGALGASKAVRAEVKSHLGALEQAGRSDWQVGELWGDIRRDVGVLLGGGTTGLEEAFMEKKEESKKEESLLELDVGKEEEEEEALRGKIGGFVAEIEERLSRLSKLARERTEILKELKEKIQTDDVSHLLLLNRRNTGIEPTLFASELEKFKPYTQRLASLLPTQQSILTDIRTLYTSLRALASPSSSSTNAKIMRRWDEAERRRRELVRSFLSAKEGYVKVREGLLGGLGFYRELGVIVGRMKAEVGSFAKGRREERERLERELDREREKEKRKPAGGVMGLEQGLKAMSIGGSQRGWGTVSPPPLPPPPPSVQSPPPQKQYNYSSTGLSLPPPPPQPQSQPQPQPQYQHTSPSQHQQHYTHQQQPYPPPPAHSQIHQTRHQTPLSSSTTSSAGSTFLPPPPPRPTQTQTPTSLSPAPMSDPYASLGMFEGHRAPPPLPPAPLAPSAPHAHNVNNTTSFVSQQPQQQGGYQAYQTPPLPQNQQMGYGYTQGQTQGGFHPPPGPPPPQTVGQQGQEYQYGGYGYGYGR